MICTIYSAAHMPNMGAEIPQPDSPRHPSGPAFYIILKLKLGAAIPSTVKDLHAPRRKLAESSIIPKLADYALDTLGG